MSAISSLMTAEKQASHFARARKATELEVTEDYVELIADLIDSQGEARAVDLAERIGVTSATVNKAIARLKEMNLVRTEPYRSIFLTEEGRRPCGIISQTPPHSGVFFESCWSR